MAVMGNMRTMKPADLHNLFTAIDRGFDCEMVLLEAELI